MKCKDCNCAKKGFFSYQPEAYVCTGVKEPFVIGDINSECTEYESKRNMQMAIESLGNDTNVGSKWIPCSEDLPKEDGEYLVTIVNTEKPTTLYFSCELEAWFDDNYIAYKVLAWQNLPKIYKEGDK